MVTTEGSAIGTPAYMSPEQGQDSRSVDARADIYSLGASLYHMVTGKLPFTANTPLALMMKHVRAELPDPRTHVPDLPADLCDLICKAMAKDPADRQQSASEMLAELKAIGTAPLVSPVVAKSASRLPVILGVLVGAAVLAGIGFSLRNRAAVVEPPPAIEEPEPEPPALAPVANSAAAYYVIDLEEQERSGELAVPPDISDPRWRDTAILLRAIPAGTFTMGAPEGEAGRELTNNKETPHAVTLTGFYMGVFEVTRAQFERIRGEDLPAYAKALPRDHVSWDDAAEFCETVGRIGLPTEAQWEYACRGGATTAYSFGDDVAEMFRYGNCRDQASERTDGPQWFEKTDAQDDGLKALGPVGSLAPNSWGLYDMHGNVFELCRDYFAYDLGSQAVTDPIGPDSGTDRVIRGGSFDRSGLAARAAARVPFAQVGHTVYVGFRVVMPIPATPAR